MSTTFLTKFQNVDSLGVIKAIGDATALALVHPTPIPEWMVNRVNGLQLTVPTITNTNLADPLANNDFLLSNVRYIYRNTSNLTVAEPAIVDSFGSVGRWIMTDNAIAFQKAAPSEPPAISNMTWVAELTSPDRLVTWRSPRHLPGTPTIDDWIGDTTPIEVDVADKAALGAFNADFEGQKIKSTNYLSGTVFEAVDTSGTWIASLSDNGTFVVEEDITGDETIAIPIAGYQRNLTASSVITLPDGLNRNISFKLAVFDAIAGSAITLDLAVSGTAIVNGGTSITGIANQIVTISNFGDAWYVN